MNALDAIEAERRLERQDLLSGELARRAQTVRLLLDGAPLSAERAGSRLDYDLGACHTALILCTDSAAEAHGVLEQAAGLLATAARVRRP
ncbi:hypothetical protein AB0A76_33750 [Streptomyces exfoliatus]|uniref:Uncharacterized protein n=1 Tax=Streptomyces exfoliatus TaxID=1905 RepID=A0ABV3D866_STREX